MPFLDAEWHELLANFTPEQLSRHASIAAHLISVGWTREGSASCLAVLRVVEEDREEMVKAKAAGKTADPDSFSLSSVSPTPISRVPKIRAVVKKKVST